MNEIFIPYDELTVGSPSNLSTNNISTNLQGFNALDLFKADYNAISADLEKVDWDSVWSSSSLEEFPEKLRDIVLDACKKHSPPKTNKPGRLTVHDRSYRSLMRKKKKLNTRLKCISSINPASPNINKIEKNLKEILVELKSLTFSKQESNERKAIDKIKTNPKYFYSHAKKHSKTKQSISQLFSNDKQVISDRKLIADTLQDQFVSTFSNPTNPDVSIPPAASPSSSLSNITFNYDDILSAIDEIKDNSSCPDFSTPAIVLKKCKHDLVKPLHLLWKNSQFWNCSILLQATAHYTCFQKW